MATFSFRLTAANSATPAVRIRDSDRQFGPAQWGRLTWQLVSRSANAVSVTHQIGIPDADGNIYWQNDGSAVNSPGSNNTGSATQENSNSISVGTVHRWRKGTGTNPVDVLVAGGQLEIVE